MQPDDKLGNVYLPDPDELSTSAIAYEVYQPYRRPTLTKPPLTAAFLHVRHEPVGREQFRDLVMHLRN